MTETYQYKNMEINEFYMGLAKRAYNHYGAVTDWKNFRGEDMPAFENLPETIQKAWHDASRFCYNQGTDSQARKYPGCQSCAG